MIYSPDISLLNRAEGATGYDRQVFLFCRGIFREDFARLRAAIEPSFAKHGKREIS
jgi:hypothetical protein